MPMARSRETYSKKEVKNKKDKKRKEKELKRAIRKSEGKKTSLDNMIAYVDEFGMITSSPPDPDRKTDIDVDSIELTIVRNNETTTRDYVRKGVVTSYSGSKGYGFIRDMESNRSIFFHANGLLEPVEENNVVVFEIGKGTKGPAAIKVKLFKE